VRRGLAFERAAGAAVQEILEKTISNELLERRALPRFLQGGISAPRDRRIARALKILRNLIAGYHGRAGVAHNLQVAGDGVPDYPYCGSVAADLKIAAHRVAWAHRGRADVYRRIAVLIDQIANHIHPADLILIHTRGEGLDLEIAYDPRETSDRERPAALNRYISADCSSRQNEVTTGLGDVSGHTASHERASLASGDVQIAHKSPAESAIAGGAGGRRVQFHEVSKQLLSGGRRMHVTRQLVIGRRR